MTTVIHGATSRTSDCRVRFGAFEPSQLPAFLAMLSRCSGSTLFRRFHGFTDGTAHARRLAASGAHRTVVAWCGQRCVGVASLAQGPAGHDLGVVVEDDWQRQGIGTALVGRLLAWARAEGVGEFGADVLSGDEFALRALRRAGAVAATLERGVYRVTVSLGPGPLPAARARR